MTSIKKLEDESQSLKPTRPGVDPGLLSGDSPADTRLQEAEEALSNIERHSSDSADALISALKGPLGPDERRPSTGMPARSGVESVVNEQRLDAEAKAAPRSEEGLTAFVRGQHQRALIDGRPLAAPPPSPATKHLIAGASLQVLPGVADQGAAKLDFARAVAAAVETHGQPAVRAALDAYVFTLAGQRSGPIDPCVAQLATLGVPVACVDALSSSTSFPELVHFIAGIERDLC
jgi:hypothetical protein